VTGQQSNDLRLALDGKPGQLDSYLETRSEDELRADIRALLGESGGRERRMFAAMAMQGMCANPNAVDRTPEVVAGAALEAADALLSALKDVQT
jgi:hypothetical protein